MSKKSEIGNEVANSMNELLSNENFTKIFHPAKKTASVNTEAVSDFESFDKFAKKKDKENDKDKEDKKDKEDDKKDEKKSDKKEKDSDKDVKKDKKKGKKGFPFWLKKKKASDKCACPSDCACKTGKCECEGCRDCAACGDKMFASAIKHMVETLIRTSAALDNMGLEKSSVATMAVLNNILDEAIENKYTFEKEALDQNDVRGMDLLLGLDDPEALEGFEEEDLDDPQSSHALEQILMKNPELVDELAPSLKNKFEQDVEEQLKDRVKSRLEQVVDAYGDESDIEELAAKPLPQQNKIPNVPPVNDSMKELQDEESGGLSTIPAPPTENEWSGKNVELDQFNVDDADVISAYKELDSWVKEAETVEGETLEDMLESYIQG